MIYKALKLTFLDKKAKYLAVFSTILSFVLYTIAILWSTNIESYIKANTPIFIILQTILILINSILTGLSFAMFYQVYNNKLQQEGGVNIIQTLASLFFSVATTGCYVCGTLIIPFLGFATFLASMPLGGLEVKIITIGMLIYSLNEFAKVVLGICDFRTNRVIKFVFSKSLSFNLKLSYWYQFKPILISFLFILLVIFLPVITSNLGTKSLINHEYGYSCSKK